MQKSPQKNQHRESPMAAEKSAAAPIVLADHPLPQRLILWLACGFGSGLIRPAPGTWGTLPGVGLAYLLMPYPGYHALAIVLVSLAGIWLCGKASDILGVHDHGSIVIDEIAGVMLALWYFQPSWATLLLGFLWFRVFDIFKPQPIKLIDKHVHGGLGIMLDDLLAGVLAWALLYLSLDVMSAL